MIILLVAVCTVAAVIALLASAHAAQAFDSAYCGSGPIPPSTNCYDTSGYHTWVYNEMDYFGGGTLAGACDGMRNSGGDRMGARCVLNTNFDYHCYGATSSYWQAYVSFGASNGAYHTIYGYADTSGCP